MRKPTHPLAAARAREPSAPPSPADPSPSSPRRSPSPARHVASKRGGHDAPLLVTRGLSAIAEARFPRAHPAVPPADCALKRCRMCGNACNVRVTACTSCCLPLTDPASWDPADAPRPGEALADESSSEYESSDESSDEYDSSDDEPEKPHARSRAKREEPPRGDDDGSGVGFVSECDETNNQDQWLESWCN